MHIVLVTGATGFLGYHVAKRLNEIGIRPRVLEMRGSRLDVLDRLVVERCGGHFEDLDAVRAACAGVDTVMHLAFKVGVGGGAAHLDEMRRVNVAGTRRLVQTAAASGVDRVIVTGSALGVGVSRQPATIDESAAWPQHSFDIPYASLRREAELEARALALPDFDVITVCPSFTFGPDDPTGAPANKLLQSIIARRLRFTLPVGFGCLDVRDFADGMLLAAQQGRSGHRYLLSGENVTASELVNRTAALAHVRAPRFRPPIPLMHAGVGALELFCRARHKPAPITRDALQIIGRYAWYNTVKARRELGWKSRPLQQSLAETIQWLRSPEATARPSGIAVA